MTQSREVLLAEIPASAPEERTLVVHKHQSGESLIELRQQTWGEGIGWFTQNTMRLEPTQVAALRQALGGQVTSVRPANPCDGGSRPQLRIHAESA